MARRTIKPSSSGGPAQRKAAKTMKEFGRGGLRSSSGDKVTRPDQAFAIAQSQARRRASGKGKRKG